MNEIEKILNECLEWEKLNISYFNEFQKVEYYRLVQFIKATKYQYQQVIAEKRETLFSNKFIDLSNLFSDAQRIAIIQIERDFNSANISISTVFKYLKHLRLIEKIEGSEMLDKEKLTDLRTKSHLFDFHIKNSVMELITNYDLKHKLPMSVYSQIS